MKKIVEIDRDSGFCFGVVNAIQRAEKELQKDQILYCLGDIVHNAQEISRLEKAGLKTINHEQFSRLKNKKVLLRAHGEPPSTYSTAEQHGLKVVDATCPVVLQLQKKIKKKYMEEGPGCQIVIYGKKGHAEVNGLVGQTEGNAIVIENEDDLEKIDFSKKVCLFSQTTKSVDGFQHIVKEIGNRMNEQAGFEFFDTICRQVANRIPQLLRFVTQYDLVFFVAGEKSSNGKFLYEECKKANSNTYFISQFEDIDISLLQSINSIGICGATSTPKWLMVEIAEKLKEILVTHTENEL
ncbi:MAG: 4-hydroxy-3-methylbut-2-enyl diphosphate reductase [Bacteroidales bacterium]|nr:4-hydroxy-3-methylbut-2-enyl diphosphate reductase [Bacteroidales bacterium]